MGALDTGGTVPRVFGVLVAAALLTGCVDTSSGTARIEGTFRAPSGGNTLTLDDGHWLLESGIRTKGGSYTLDGDEVAFFITESNHPAYLQGRCHKHPETYSWSVVDDELRFRQVGDPCDWSLKGILLLGAWERTG